MLAWAGGRVASRFAAFATTLRNLPEPVDEIARGLIEAFAESDQSAVPSLPDAPGLFTYPGSPAMPASGTLLVGLAGSIRINPSVDPAQGGNLALLRDGGIAGDPAYVYNTSGGSAYADRLNQYVTALSETRSFDSAAQISTGATLGGFASTSGAWLQEARRTANDNADYANTLLERTSGKRLSNGNRHQHRRGNDSPARTRRGPTSLYTTDHNHRQHAEVAAGDGRIIHENATSRQLSVCCPRLSLSKTQVKLAEARRSYDGRLADGVPASDTRRADASLARSTHGSRPSSTPTLCIDAPLATQAALKSLSTTPSVRRPAHRCAATTDSGPVVVQHGTGRPYVLHQHDQYALDGAHCSRASMPM